MNEIPPSSVIEELRITRWEGPFSAEDRQRAVAALESGKVVFLPDLPFAVTASEERYLRPEAAGGERKNISLDPITGKLSNAAMSPEDAAALGAMIERFGDAATSLVSGLIPHYAGELQRARTSFRPVEISGRAYSPRHDDRRLHVDAFPTRPMRGDRILRVFSNIAPDGSVRCWHVGEPFPQFAEAFLPRLRRSVPGEAWVLARFGLTKGRRSTYDEIMLRLHDTGKQDEGYQASCRKAAVSFPPGTSWMCFTDQVLHAALSGHCALEQTFHLPVHAMAEPSQAPVRVLERLSGRSLV